MRSGDPDPTDDLRVILLGKENSPSTTVEIVSEAARWLKAALKGAQVEFSYASCEERDHYGFATFTVARAYRGAPVSLDLKIAEIRDMPYAFARVRGATPSNDTLFPFFGSLSSADARDLLLHYVADFVISTDG